MSDKGVYKHLVKEHSDYYDKAEGAMAAAWWKAFSEDRLKTLHDPLTLSEWHFSLHDEAANSHWFEWNHNHEH